MATLLPFAPQKQLDAYVQALNAHDVDAAMAFLAEGFCIEFVDYGSTMTRDQARAALEWDKGTNGHLRYDDLEVDDRTVTGIFTETNDFLTLVGIEALQSRTTYRFDEHGLIAEQKYAALPDQPSFQEAMKPAVAWAETHRAGELAEVYPDGRMVYNEEMARRWVRLLRAWRRATG